MTVRRRSIDASLSSLTVTSGSAVTLSPTFSASTFAYSCVLAFTQSAPVIAAITTHGSASVTGTGTVSPAVGDTSYPLVVTAEDGNRATYTVAMRRRSNVATLSSLSLSSAAI